MRNIYYLRAALSIASVVSTEGSPSTLRSTSSNMDSDSLDKVILYSSEYVFLFWLLRRTIVNAPCSEKKNKLFVLGAVIENVFVFIFIYKKEEGITQFSQKKKCFSRLGVRHRKCIF